jgi:hypothetical protein
VSRIQGTCSKGTDETVLTKFVTVTDGAPYKHGHDHLSGYSWNIAELA